MKNVRRTKKAAPKTRAREYAVEVMPTDWWNRCYVSDAWLDGYRAARRDMREASMKNEGP